MATILKVIFIGTLIIGITVITVTDYGDKITVTVHLITSDSRIANGLIYTGFDC